MNRLIALLALLAGIVAGVYLIGNRLAPESMAVIVGVICGVGAGVPSALLILLASRTMKRLNGPKDSPPAQPPQPTVIVVGGQPAQHARLPAPDDYSLFGDSGRRWQVVEPHDPQPRIIGEEGNDEGWHFPELTAVEKMTFAEIWGEELGDGPDPTRPDLAEDSYLGQVGPEREFSDQVGPGRVGGRRPPTEAELEAVKAGMSIRQMRFRLGIGYERAKWLIEGGPN